VGLRGQLIARLRRWYLPYAAVFQADLTGLARSWVLRAWFVLTVLVALVALLQQGPAVEFKDKPGGAVLAALFQGSDRVEGSPQTLKELLKIYIVIWVSVVIVLTGGTISSELGVVADAVLSRGISRWQYFLGKWSARLTAVLCVYALVIVPTALILWLNTPARNATVSEVTQVDLTVAHDGEAPASLVLHHQAAPLGIAIAVGKVAALLVFVVTCGVAFSATFDSTVISIAVGWVSIYGTGLMLSLLDIRELPDILNGRYVAADQYWQLGGWCIATCCVALLTGRHFSARDL
jgi:hypothetical protein